MKNLGYPHFNFLYQTIRELRRHNLNSIVRFSHHHIKQTHSFHPFHHQINHPPHNSKSWLTQVLEHKPPLPNHLQLLEHIPLRRCLRWLKTLKGHGQIQELYKWQDPYIHFHPILKSGYQISILAMVYQPNST